ncbi:TPA: hypothetical protein ACPSKZ_000695 [Legionella anisa]|uniref:hypothetical protein n=1 Tax=Legionella anisa TaxID=28082 RepID=UPI0022442C8B|nr:hypothetical protein [Legionella anisa]MCW8425607.1 hypothetical protein [Legionella anisa]MCW8448964.1 hypothetical protein [Legionella anisa]
MSEFKIGDKVKYKNTNVFLGYVSHYFLGHLFTLDDPEIRVHIGNNVHVVNKASELELYEDLNKE